MKKKAPFFVLILLGLAISSCNNYGLLDKLEQPSSSSSSSTEVFTSNYYVFVSSWTTLGHMGGSPYNDVCSASTGADKADCACTRAAASRGLRKSSTHVFRAWLSVDATPGPQKDARCRVQALGSCSTNFPSTWFNTQGQVVVNNFNGLESSTLTNAIRYDEFGQDQGPSLVWTGTIVGGTSNSSLDCEGWTDQSAGFSGQVGDRTQSTTANLWTQQSPNQTCNTSQRIYCVAAP